MESCGCYTEKSYRTHFLEKFGFLKLNTQMIKTLGRGKFVISFDPSYISKSGNKTPRAGYFWSYFASKSKYDLVVNYKFKFSVFLESADTVSVFE